MLSAEQKKPISLAPDHATRPFKHHLKHQNIVITSQIRPCIALAKKVSLQANIDRFYIDSTPLSSVLLSTCFIVLQTGAFGIHAQYMGYSLKFFDDCRTSLYGSGPFLNSSQTAVSNTTKIRIFLLYINKL